MRFAELADQLQHAVGGHAGLERALRRHLVDDAIGQRIGKRQPEFDDVRAESGEGFHDLERFVEIRITGGDVGDEGFLVAGAELLESGGEAVGHGCG